MGNTFVTFSGDFMKIYSSSHTDTVVLSAGLEDSVKLS